MSDATIKAETQSIVFRISFGGKSADAIAALGLDPKPVFVDGVSWRKTVVEDLKALKGNADAQGLTAKVERLVLAKIPRKELIVALLNGADTCWDSSEVVMNAEIRGGRVQSSEARVRSL